MNGNLGRSGRTAKGFLSGLSLTNWIIIVNVILFFVFYFISLSNKDFYSWVELLPSSVIIGERVWTVLTSVFTHVMFFHLFVNMFSLYFLGNVSEKIIGRKRMFWFYLVAGIVGSLAYVFFAMLGNSFYRADFIFSTISTPAVGASGAIFGLLGLLAMLIPRNKVYLIVGPLIAIILEFTLINFLPVGVANVFDIIMSILVFVMIFVMFSPNPRLRKIAVPVEMPLWFAPIAAIVPLVIIGYFVKLPIGNTAHFGGLIVGLLFGYYLRVKYRSRVRLLQKYMR